MARRRNVTLTEAQRARHAQIRKQVSADMPRYQREASLKKAELDARIAALRMLKAAREARGLSLADVAERSGIDKSRLSKLENDPYPNPTLSTLMRIAEALGKRLELTLREAA